MNKSPLRKHHPHDETPQYPQRNQLQLELTALDLAPNPLEESPAMIEATE